ncbi:pyridoxal phosphate phosphatase PHOSPHO2-like [Ptychodera flava]|uniref:pyridoxal phosphate phosphatase PHOSPHO2-like n=1 Tax=Ptychodera flava TaxID=63121 RepID=UPI00396AABFC
MAQITLRKKILMVCDFDLTIVDGDNSDTWLWKLLPDGKVPEPLTKRYSEHGSWNDYMGEVFQHMHSLKITPQDIIECINQMPFTAGMKELLQYQSKADNIDLIVLSDANAVFINSRLEAADLRQGVKKVITNPSYFDNEGCLKIEHYHSHGCSSCPVNMCKRKILQAYIKQQKQDGVEYDHVCYAGDGSNDFCPSQSLGNQDVVFPRKGYELVDIISLHKSEGKEFSPKVIPWNSGSTIIEAVKTMLA